MRRLFSTFAHGVPGVGLLLFRVAIGVAILVQGASDLLDGPPLVAVLLHVLSIGLGVLLLVGLCTPLAGTLVAVEGLWRLFSSGYPLHWIMLATLGAALAMTGPGAWSIDAHLFGWKRLEIPDRESRNPDP